MRLWADGGPACYRAVPAAGAKRRGVAGAAEGAGGKAAAVWLPAVVGHAAAGQAPGRDAAVGGESQAGASDLPGRRAGDAAQGAEAAAGSGAGAVGAAGGGQPG